jgi:D-alanyl-D-alanine carboxypeptidase/D-alanyl-D-alanine-endopeptidase (penicillin-binding protein 4)
VRVPLRALEDLKEARLGFGRRIGDSLHVPARGLRRWLVVLIVLVVAAAGGGTIALTSPALVQRLGLAEPVAAPPPPVPRSVLGPLPADAPSPTRAGLAQVLDGPADAMPGQFIGLVVDPATGTELWSRTPERPLVPGSTGKLVTGAAALLTLNPTDRLVTRVVAAEQPDTVVLVGGGDPTLSTLPDGEDGVYPEPPRISELARDVRESVPGQIRRVLVDTSRYSGPRLAEGWDAADVQGGYIAPIESLMVDGGRIDPKLQDGPRVDEPALAAGRALAEALGADPGLVEVTTAVPSAEWLGAVYSAPVADLVEHMLRSSDNVLAETLAREVAVVRNGEPSFAGAAAQIVAALGQAGFDPTGTVLVDGSGLSTQNRVPARLLGALLAAAAAPAWEPLETDFLRPIITGLPVAGGDGTLDDRFAQDGAASSGRGVVRAKTGSLTGVSSLAGVVTNADGRLLVFALMSNGVSPATARPRQDAMAAGLSRCGCR